ncbi:uncharacterized protein LOC108630103 [Ceratina calcarata]|uniref:RNA-directed DNA polymerase n=1 Tax=Ceratina calcarata TaxID=156304 RepID=A0AAJ7JAV9_9HYME|nr:uncharacterized protein LOC108630103 [Ceratina calcarata]
MEAYLGQINQTVAELANVDTQVEDGDLAMIILCGLPEEWDMVISTLCNVPEEEFKPSIVKRRILAEAERGKETLEKLFKMSNEESDTGNDVVAQRSSLNDKLREVEMMKNRLRVALPSGTSRSKGGTESSDSEDEDDQDDDQELHRGMQTLTFKDVEESISTFSGDNNENVRYWLQEFEDMAKLCEWNGVQKVIYAKRLLRGSAKLFVNYEKCCRKWSEMKQALISKFSQSVDAHKIHKKLSRRFKKSNESYQEYIYQMLEIGKQADMEIAAIIKYIINGVQDDESNKMILYGARTIRELKQKFESYEAMKENSRTKSRKAEEKTKKPACRVAGQENVRRCFLWGDRSHLSASCPTKNKVMKCFKCQEYGHVASACSGANKPLKDVSSTSEDSRKKRLKEVQIEHCKLVVLVDSGSDLSLMRADHYVRIDDTIYPINIHVLPDALTPHGLILGTDFFDSVELVMKGEEIIIEKLDVPEVFSMNTETTVHEVDLSHIVVSEHKEAVKELIENYKPDKTCEVGITMNIILSDDIPVHQRPRRLSPGEKDEVNNQIALWLEDGIIQRCHSDYASPIVLVKKKNGSTRICVDYRQLNKRIIKDRYPLPLIEDELDSLQGAKVFSTLDLKNGFFHVSIEENSRKYTAFVIPNGHYEFLKVPFGLCNSPAVFQKFIHAVFSKVITAGIARTYLDDIIVLVSDTVSVIENLRTVLSVASQHGLVINWSKCNLLQTRVEFLGHIVENGHVQPSEDKTKAVIKFPKPQFIKDVQSFLGLTGYFRKFIHQYSVIARPLSNLLKKDSKFKFETAEQEAFDKLKLILSGMPGMKLYCMGAETELHTDASSLGYGAILMQRDNEDGIFHPVYYASGKTTPAEEKYPSYELEVLAIIKSLRKFRVYLLGIPFTIVTDCQAFALTMNKKDLCWKKTIVELLLDCVMLKKKMLSYIKFVTMLNNTERRMQTQVVRQAHERGHFGVTKTEDLIKRDYWFKGMRQQSENMIKMREDPEIKQMIEEEWITMFNAERDEIRARAKEKIAEVQAQNRKTFNKNRKEATEYTRGQLVAIKRTQAAPGLKFHSKYLGPYRVTKLLRNNRYMVQKVGEHEGPQMTSTAADYMKT